MGEPAEETVEAVPEWAVAALQKTIREYRYTGDYLPQSSPEHVRLRLRRGDRPLGNLELRHTMRGPKHYLHLGFEARDRSTRARLLARSLQQFEQAAMFLLEAVCRYGCEVNRRWCEDCSQASRHTQGEFRNPDAASAAAPAEGEQGPPGP